MTHSSFIQILWKCLFLFLPCTILAQERPSLGHWIAEDQSGIMDFTIREDTLELIVPEGLTLWYKDRLTGDYEISYHICMVMNGGKHDRLSDMNCFWAANDPKHPGKLLARSTWRNGVFRNYNTLNLFYVGYGGIDVCILHHDILPHVLMSGVNPVPYWRLPECPASHHTIP